MLKKILIIVGIFIIILLLIIVVYSIFSNRAVTSNYGESIVLESMVPGKQLVLSNQDSFNSLIADLGILEKGALNLDNSRPEKVNTIKIIYTPEEQSMFPFLGNGDQAISNGSYRIENGELIISIYVNNDLIPSSGSTDAYFNQQLLRFLTLLSPTFSSSTGDKSVEDQFGRFEKFMKEKFYSSGQTPSYPINIQ